MLIGIMKKIQFYVDTNQTLSYLLDEDTTLSTPARNLLEALDNAIDVYEYTDNLNDLRILVIALLQKPKHSFFLINFY